MTGSVSSTLIAAQAYGVPRPQAQPVPFAPGSVPADPAKQSDGAVQGRASVPAPAQREEAARIELSDEARRFLADSENGAREAPGDSRRPEPGALRPAPAEAAPETNPEPVISTLSDAGQQGLAESPSLSTETAVTVPESAVSGQSLAPAAKREAPFALQRLEAAAPAPPGSSVNLVI